jgi:hypothetical protein
MIQVVIGRVSGLIGFPGLNFTRPFLAQAAAP